MDGGVLGVVVPVHHGADTVHRSLRSLARQVSPLKVHVVVAVNDGTSESLVAAVCSAKDVTDAGLRCSVITTPPSRVAAITTAERHLPPGPRLYLDQDAVLSPTGLRDIAVALAPGSGTHFAAPAVALGAPGTTPSATVRHYFRVWATLPYVRDSPATMGAYAVSQVGRERWTQLPELHSDDKFVRLWFSPAKRRVVTSCTYEVVLPKGASELVRARRRYRAGHTEVNEVLAAEGVVDLARTAGVLRS